MPHEEIRIPLDLSDAIALRDEWKRQFRLMEAAEAKAEEQIAALTEDRDKEIINGLVVQWGKALRDLTAKLKSSKQIREAEKEILTKEISINAELRLENKRLRMVLQRIKDWPYDIMGDCVYDARKDAQDALKQGEEATNG